MKKRLTMFFLFLILTITSLGAVEKNKIEIKDGWFYVNGEKFFIKGVCYFENHGINGRVEQNSSKVIDYEFKKIKEAGFNTVKSYLTPERIAAAKKYGLMIAQSANLLCFNGEYQDPAHLQIYEKQTEETVRYSQEYDNVLYYVMDNEPSIMSVYNQGEKFMEDTWRKFDRQVKTSQPETYTTVQMMPPSAFADVSMCDVISLNLYPWNPARDSIGYMAYADWYRRSHAVNKPFLISEYGWTEDLKNFSPKMMSLLDEQIKAGASGSFLFTWRAWGKEKERDNLWWGVVPNNALPNDYRNKPRPIFYDYQKYFEAIAIEPKVGGVYDKKLPLEIYGTDKTGSITAVLEGQKINLKKQGRYWWLGEVSFGPELYGEKTVTLEAKDKNGKTLVKKKIKVFLCAERRSMSVKILNDGKTLKNGGTYEAKIIVVDEKGKRVPNQLLRLGFTQGVINPWDSLLREGTTDANGEYFFKEEDLLPGYFNLMADVDTSRKDVVTFADVAISRVESYNIERDVDNAPDEYIDFMDSSGWFTFADEGSRINLDTDTENALVISYDLGVGKWVGLSEKTLHNLSAYRGIKLTFRDGAIKDKIEFKIEDKDGSSFVAYINPGSNGDGWVTTEVNFNELLYSHGDKRLKLSGAKLTLAFSKDKQTSPGSAKLIIRAIELLR